MRGCELCGTKTNSGIRHAKHSVCFGCIDKVLDFAITAGMMFDDEVAEV